MDHGSRRTPDDRFEQVSRSLLRWVLGPGLLSLHVGVYLSTVVALLLWNFARTPNDVWVDGPLRRWGLVVVFHITAVAAGWAAWRLMRLGETPPATVQRAQRTGAVNSGRQFDTETAAIPVSHASTLQPAANGHLPPSMNDGARRWLRDSVRLVREVVGETPTNGNHAKPVTSPAASTVAGPGITEWGALFVRRTREMMASARDHVSPAQQARNEKLNGALNGVTVPQPPDPSRTWPENTTPDLNATPVQGTWPAASHGPIAANDYPEANGSAAHNGHLNGANGANGAAYPASDHTPIDPMKPAPKATDAADLAATEDARWTWVESAASAWMSRRERDDPPAELPETPPPPIDDATTTP